MSSPEPLVPSRRLRGAAEAERDRLSRDLQRVDTRVETLQTELHILETRRAELRDQLALLARISWQPDESAFPTRRNPGTAGHLQAVPADEPPIKATLRGARIRETAVLLLASSANPTRPIHYQQWYKLLRNSGYGIDAADPPAAFLTQITRSPLVRRVDAPGVYALDLDVPRQLRERLHQLQDKLRQTTVDHDSAEEISRARDQRTELITKIRSTERQLEEALRSLGDSRRATESSATTTDEAAG